MNKLLLCTVSLLLLLCGCSIATEQSGYIQVGDKWYAALEISTRHLVGSNLRVLHTIEISKDGTTKVVNTSAATSSGLMQAALPGGGSAAVMNPFLPTTTAK